MDNIDIFNNSSIIIEKKTPLKIISWVTIIVITLITLLFISIFYQYNQYLHYVGTVIKEEGNYHVLLYVEKDEIVNFYNNELLINSVKTEYKIKSISENYYLINQQNEVYEVIIECTLNNKLVIDNNLIELNFQLPKTTMFKSIINKIKKELS